DGIDKIEVERIKPSGESLVFAKEGTTWMLTQPYRAKIDSSAIDRLIGSLVDARVEKGVPQTTPADAGVDSPTAAIVLFKEGKSHRVVLGNMTLGASGRVYAANPEKPKKPIAVRRSMISDLLKSGMESGGPVGEAIKPIAEFRPRNFLAEGSPMAADKVLR